MLCFTCVVFSPHLLTQQVCDFNLFIFSWKYNQVNTWSEPIFQSGRFNCICVLIVVMFLGIIDLGLAPALQENRLFGCYHSHSLLLLYKLLRVGVSTPPTSHSCSLLEKLELLEVAKQVFGDNPLVCLPDEWKRDYGHAGCPYTTLTKGSHRKGQMRHRLCCCSAFASFAARRDEISYTSMATGCELCPSC